MNNDDNFRSIDEQVDISESELEFHTSQYSKKQKAENENLVISKNMRKVLIEDLGYKTFEVNTMEPTIAKVVLERELQRPKKGMPETWIRKNVGSSTDR